MTCPFVSIYNTKNNSRALMNQKKASFAMAAIPAVAAIGIMLKMNIDHDQAISAQHNVIQKLEERLEDQKSKINAVDQLCKSDVDCPRLIINRFDEMKQRIESLSDTIKEKEQAISAVSSDNDKKQETINGLEAELRKVNDTLRVTRQTVDAQISVELESVEEQIDKIRQDYEKVIANLQEKLKDAESLAQNEIQEKEDKFRELHKRSINNLLGMVDSLAQDRESRIIPLISIYNDSQVKNQFICDDDQDLSPTEMIFSKHMDKHWLTWPVTVQTNSQEELRAETESGYSLHVAWENGDNMYELTPGDNITIQFQPNKDQTCGSPISGRRAVFTTH